MMPAWFLQIYSELNVWHAGPVLLAGQVGYLDVPTVCVCVGGGRRGLRAGPGWSQVNLFCPDKCFGYTGDTPLL
jgi:hypothetical protein